MTRLCKHSTLCAFHEAVLPGGCQLRVQVTLQVGERSPVNGC